MVALERWSLWRGGRSEEVVAIMDSTVLSNYHKWLRKKLNNLITNLSEIFSSIQRMFRAFATDWIKMDVYLNWYIRSASLFQLILCVDWYFDLQGMSIVYHLIFATFKLPIEVISVYTVKEMGRCCLSSDNINRRLFLATT